MSSYTYDRINLIDLSIKIADFAKTHSPKKEFRAIAECTSYNKILDYLFKYANGDERNISTLKKLPSGNVPVSSLGWLYDLLRDSEKKDEDNTVGFKTKIMHRCADLENSIKKADNKGENISGIMFLDNLKNEVDPIYFTVEEYQTLKCSYDPSENVNISCNFIGNLFIHALKCVAYNLPYFVSRRMFHEALTLSVGNPMRIKLLKCAADNQNGYAALMYANAIYKENKSLDYFLIAGGFKDDINKFTTGKPRHLSSQSNALWEIGFMLETHELPESQIDYLDRYIDIDGLINQQIRSYDMHNVDLTNIYMFDGYKILQQDIFKLLHYTNNRSVEYALKLYIYITMTDLTFPKAFNSIGKIILGDYLDPKADFPSLPIDKERFKVAKNYLEIAIRLGNTNAMVNLAVYYYRKSKYDKANATKIELDEMRKYFEKAAALDESEAQHCLGEILLAENKFDEACMLLKTAADKNDSHACHSIGKAYISAMKSAAGEKYLEKAISLRCYDAAYDLAWLYLVEKTTKTPNSQAVYKQYGLRLLQDNYPNMSDEYKAKSRNLLKDLDISI